MTKRVPISSLVDKELRAQIDSVDQGNTIIFEEAGRYAAVLIPGEAFKAVQNAIRMAMEFPLCWDDPLVPVIGVMRKEIKGGTHV